MPDYIGSVDPGNGGTNAVLAKPSGSGYKSVYFPSVRAAATGDSLGLGAEMELQYEYADWYGHRYVVGDDVLRVTKRHLERHTGINRYGNELYQFLVAVAVGELGVKEGSVDLTLFAPPGMYLSAKADHKPRTWRYEHITVWPEGIGAAACFILDDEGQLVESDVLEGEVLVLDMGAYTLDALKMVNGNFNPEELEHATFENGGIMVHILEPILHTLKRMGDDFTLLSIEDAERVLRLGLISGDYSLRVAGQEVDVEPLVNKYRERYAEWIANNILDGVFSGLRGIKSMILVGGGALIAEDFMTQWYGEKVLNRKKHPTTKKVFPVDFNAVGGLRLALNRIRSAQAT
jgi:hypothetical protein